MDILMQTLFEHILAHDLERCYGQTDYKVRRKAQDEVGRRLWEQLDPEKKALLEDLQRAYDDTQMAELEAMFLASFDQCKALALPHCAQNVS